MKKLITLLLVFMLTTTVNMFAANTYEDENGVERLSYTVNIPGGKVTELSTVVLSFESDYQISCDVSQYTDGIFDSEGNNLTPGSYYVNSVNSGNENRSIQFVLETPITTPGVYTLRMAEGQIYERLGVDMTNYSIIKGLSTAAIEIQYIVAPAPLVPGDAVTPAVGSPVMDLNTITIPFPEAATIQGNVADVTINGKAVDNVVMSADGLTATITYSQELSAGTATLSIPEGFFNSANSASVNDALEYTWNIVAASMSVNVQDFLFKGDDATVTLDLTNGLPFVGFQADLTLPAGLTASDYTLNRADGHNINTGKVRGNDNAIRLLSYSDANAAYTGTEGTFLTFKVTADENFEGGEIVVSNIKFGDASAVKYNLPQASDAIESRTYVSSIAIAPEALNLETNDKAELTAIVTPDAAYNKELTWTSSHPELVEVKVEEGKVMVTALAETGENQVTIIATANDGSGVTASIPVTVVYTHAATIEVAPAYVNIEALQTAQLAAVKKDANGEVVETNKTVVWESSDNEVATVDQAGLVTAHKVGEVTITATIQGTNLKATATVEVKATLAESIEVTPSDIQLETGSKFTLSAQVDANATNKKVVWSVVEGSEDYVLIDATTGEVTALAITPEGTPAVVKATTVDGSDLSATANVTVVATLATSVTVEKVNPEARTDLKDKESIELKAVLEGETNKNILWTAVPAENVTIEVNEGVATVTAGATIGQVTVYATVENTNVQGSFVLNIIPTPAETIVINYDAETQPVKFETGAASFELKATVGPELATDKTYTWSTTDADIAYVNEDYQVVFGQKTGEVTLTAKANDVNVAAPATLTFNVVYTLAETIAISKPEADDFKLKAGETLQLTATATPATNKTIVWSSDNEAVTVDENGLVTAVKYVESNVTIKAQIFNGEEAVVTAEQIITLAITEGDVNNNGNVNITDVQAVASYILGNDPEGFIFAAADVNTDEEIDIADIILLVDLVLEQEPATPEQQALINRARQYADGNNNLSINDFEIEEGETRQIAIQLDNNIQFSAFQADVYLPEGLTLVQENGVNQVALSDRKVDHSLASALRNDGSVRMLSYSLGINAYTGTTGDFVYLTVKAEEGFIGDFQIRLDNIIFVQPDQTECFLAPVVTNVVGKEYVSVEGVEGDELVVKVVGNTIVAPEGAEVYDLNGVRVNAENLAKGIYIVKVGNQIVKVII